MGLTHQSDFLKRYPDLQCSYLLIVDLHKKYSIIVGFYKIFEKSECQMKKL